MTEIIETTYLHTTIHTCTIDLYMSLLSLLTSSPQPPNVAIQCNSLTLRPPLRVLHTRIRRRANRRARVPNPTTLSLISTSPSVITKQQHT